MSLPIKINFFFLTPCPLLRPRQQPRCLLSIFHAGVLGLQAQEPLHEKLKYLFASNLVGAHPLGGGRTGWVQAAAQFGWGRGGDCLLFILSSDSSCRLLQL